MDELAAASSPIHDRCPLSKLVTTVIYILVVISFGKYELAALSVMVLYPALLFALSGIPVRTCFYKLRFVLPLVLAVGLFNPIFDRAPRLMLGPLAVSGGVLSMATLMLKGVLCLTASFLLAATTGIDALCAALRRLHVPPLIVTLLLLTYRYVAVMTEELSVMTQAYHLRAPGQKGIRFDAWGSFLGQLLLRSMDRAQELYESMRLRGFDGRFYYAHSPRCTVSDALFAAVSVGFFALARACNVAQLLGTLLMR